jgi:alpha-1,2-mannosyltransferase
MAEPVKLERRTVAGFTSATVAAIAVPVAGRANALAGVGVALACLVATPWIARVLPAALDGAFRRRRMTSLLWIVLAITAVLQMGRLSAFMADASREWGATVPDPSATHHACLSAYVYAADLARRGVDNLYDASWYPIFDPPGPTCRIVESRIQGIGPWASDAYQYPPPFLLLPRAAIALTSSFDAIRAWWFAIQALLFVAAALWVARWIGGREGLVLGLLIPAVLGSIEPMINFQFGQFHAVAMMLACGGMIAFEEKRASLGGGLLAAAILSKLFPAVLLIVLVARRQWRALAWTAVFGAAFTLAGFVVLGPKPYAAFFGYQLPRLASGAAFAFTHLGRNAAFLASRNFSIEGVGEKLRLLGAPDAAISLAHALPWIYTILLVLLAALTARGPRTRVRLLVVSLALLNLAALRSPLAPSFYVLAPVLWVLALLATQVNGRKWLVAALVPAWVVVVGTPPLPDRVDLIVGLVCQGFAIALLVTVIGWRSGASRTAEAMSRAAPSADPLFQESR